MGQVSTNEIKPGMKLEVDKEPFLVISNDFVKPGKGQSFNRIRLKNILTARVVEKTFKSGEKLDLADVDEKRMRYLYQENDAAIFMDDTSFEQLSVPFSVLKETRNWLLEDTLYEMILYKGEIVEVISPTFMELKITETSPGVRGDTASGRVMKPATLETGVTIQVPIFVEEGQTIKIDTRTNEYVSRV